MSGKSSEQEPSIEEILASIRQIIADDEEAAPSAPMSISDIFRTFGAGAVGGAKSLADVFGAGTDVSQYLGDISIP